MRRENKARVQRERGQEEKRATKRLQIFQTNDGRTPVHSEQWPVSLKQQAVASLPQTLTDAGTSSRHDGVGQIPAISCRGASARI